MRLKTLYSFFLNSITGMIFFAFPQPIYSNPCEMSGICVSYNDQPYDVWYVWVFLVFLLLLILRCLIVCCMQCWIKSQARFFTRRMITVVTLSSTDSVFGGNSQNKYKVSESSQCPLSQSWTPHLNTESSFTSSAISLEGLDSGAPPSYEELFNISKL